MRDDSLPEGEGESLPEVNDDSLPGVEDDSLPGGEDDSLPQDGLNGSNYDQLAGITQRAGARAIDWALLLSIWLLMLVLNGSAADDAEGAVPVGILLVWIAMVAAYETAMVAISGQTIGKRVLRIRVATLENGQNPSIVRSFLRVAPVLAVVVVAGSIFPFVLVFLYYTAGFAPETRRGLLDRLAGTAVVKAT